MDRLYSKGNYIVFYKDVDDQATTFFPKGTSFFQKSDDGDYYTIKTATGKRNIINIADIATLGKDEIGAATYADEDEFLQFLTGNTSTFSGTISWGVITGSIANQVDLNNALSLKLESGDNVSVLVNDAGYLVENYEERWDSFNSVVSNAWNEATLTGAPANRNVLISVDPNSNNTTIGIREVGSPLNRFIRVDNDSSATFAVRTDGSGKIEIYTADILATFTVQGYLN